MYSGTAGPVPEPATMVLLVRVSSVWQEQSGDAEGGRGFQGAKADVSWKR